MSQENNSYYQRRPTDPTEAVSSRDVVRPSRDTMMSCDVTRCPPGLTGLLVEVQDVVVGAGQLPHDLPVVLALGQPAVAGEAERHVQHLVLHVHVLDVPAGGRSCRPQCGEKENGIDDYGCSFLFVGHFCHQV